MCQPDRHCSDFLLRCVEFTKAGLPAVGGAKGDHGLPQKCTKPGCSFLRLFVSFCGHPLRELDSVAALPRWVFEVNPTALIPLVPFLCHIRRSRETSPPGASTPHWCGNSTDSTQSQPRQGGRKIRGRKISGPQSMGAPNPWAQPILAVTSSSSTLNLPARWIEACRLARSPTKPFSSGTKDDRQGRNRHLHFPRP